MCRAAVDEPKAQQARMQQHQVRAPPPTNQGPSLADQQRSAAQKRDQQRALADQQRKDVSPLRWDVLLRDMLASDEESQKG